MTHSILIGGKQGQVMDIANLLKEYIDCHPIKAVVEFDAEHGKIKYSKEIKQHREINTISGEEELVRAYLLTKLANELGYKLSNLEIEKEYEIGRPKVTKPRIDVIVRNDDGAAFLFCELKSPHDYEKDKDEIIEKQLFNVASQELGQGRKVQYLVLHTFELVDNDFRDKCLLIDYGKFSSFDSWKEVRDYSDELPIRYGRARKEPFIKGGKKDLESSFTHIQLDSIRKNLHNVLWGGGGTDDNDVFSSLVNIILAKIQDESEKKPGEKYDFQIFSYKDGGSIESNEELFERINALYRRALRQRLNITDESKLNKSYVIDENKFAINKLKFAISELERFSFVDGKNSFDGKDILGDFFEGIIREGFKQSKGQFFTHINIVRFILWGLQLDEFAIDRVNTDLEIPYVIDPSAGSGTFLIEYMKFITENLKRRFNLKLNATRDVEDKFQRWFMPDRSENKWADNFIYGVEINFNLGTATKVNMILHGDGSSNIFVKDGLLPFRYYEKDTAPNYLRTSIPDSYYFDKDVNGQFDVVISNPPFSVDLDNETKKNVTKEFIFGGKRNSENLFIERWYQLLKPNGRLGVVLPESVFDTTENKYIRLFVYKYFKIKAVVSLPDLTFSPFTTTKTSLLFAQKKTPEEVESWNSLWNKYSKEWGILKTRCENLIKVYVGGKDRTKYPSISSLNEQQEKDLLISILSQVVAEELDSFTVKQIISKFIDELSLFCKYDTSTKYTFGFVNTWWVFGKVVNEQDYHVFMAEVQNVGYKKTKRGEKIMPNELFRTDTNGEILVDDGVFSTVLDHMRRISWD